SSKHWERSGQLSDDVDRLGRQLWDEVGRLWQQLSDEVGGLRQQLSDEVGPLRQQLSDEMSGLRQQLLDVSASLYQATVVGPVRDAVSSFVPDNATVLVVSKGDNELLRLEGRVAWHFPQSEVD